MGVVAYLVTISALLAASVGAVQEFAQYAPLAPSPLTWSFIAAWIASSVGVLTIWMWKLK